VREILPIDFDVPPSFEGVAEPQVQSEGEHIAVLKYLFLPVSPLFGWRLVEALVPVKEHPARCKIKKNKKIN